MVDPPITSATELQSTNKDDESIALEESDNILQARIDSLENQGNKDDFPISDVAVPCETSQNTTNIAAKYTGQLETLPNAGDSFIDTSPTQRAPSRLIEEADLFEDGYDSDGKIGPFSDAILLEGEQDFDEDQLGTDNNADNNADDIKSDGNSNIDVRSESFGNSEDEEEEFNHTESLNAIKTMDLKTVKLELYLRLEINVGKKSELQLRLLEAIRLKKKRFGSKAEVKAAKASLKKKKWTNEKKKSKKKILPKIHSMG